MHALQEYANLVDGTARTQGLRRYFVWGQVSDKPLSEAMRSQGLSSAPPVVRRGLTAMNDEIDRRYAHLRELMAKRSAATDTADRESLERQFQDGLAEIRRLEAFAARLMRQEFEASGLMQRLDAGVAALRRAKELLAEREGPSATDASQ